MSETFEIPWQQATDLMKSRGFFPEPLEGEGSDAVGLRVYNELTDGTGSYVAIVVPEGMVNPAAENPETLLASMLVLGGAEGVADFLGLIDRVNDGTIHLLGLYGGSPVAVEALTTTMAESMQK